MSAAIQKSPDGTPRPPKTALPAEQHHVATDATRYLGVTAPVSLAGPDDHDARLSTALIATLESMDLFPSTEDSGLREKVLGKLHALVKRFVRDAGVKRGLPPDLAVETGGTIFSFGSFRLGVHGPGSDVDTLCVVPRHVTRDDFFADMFALLQARDDVTELAAVPDAYVPVITFEMDGVPIDLLMARLDVPVVPEGLDLGDSNILRKLDEKDVRSLNGSRVTDEILRLVPDVNEFRMALRAIKRWAKVRGVYSNVMGFLGGVAWAMLVARVCQLYPNANAGTLVIKFFNILLKWKWPQPVLLKPIEDGPLNVRIWNPKLYPSDRQHRMPIITPAYPSMCATHNVSESTLRIMLDEFAHAQKVCEAILRGTADWKVLFTPHAFFRKYKYYLQVVCSSGTKDRHLKWSGLVEAKVRMLVQRLEAMDEIELVHPLASGVHRAFACDPDRADEERVAVAHGSWVGRVPAPSEDEVLAAEKEGKPVIYTTSFYLGLVVKPAPTAAQTQGGVAAPPRRQLNITWATREFQELVQNWDAFDYTTMAVTVQHIKRSDLPSDVAQSRAAVATSSSDATAQSKKRKSTNGTATEATATEAADSAKRVKRDDGTASPAPMQAKGA